MQAGIILVRDIRVKEKCRGQKRTDGQRNQNPGDTEEKWQNKRGQSSRVRDTQRGQRVREKEQRDKPTDYTSDERCTHVDGRRVTNSAIRCDSEICLQCPRGLPAIAARSSTWLLVY